MLDIFRTEATELSRSVTELTEDEWNLPTRCTPWSVRELLAHLSVAVAWLPDMLAAPAPGTPEVSASTYYRPDTRFAPQTNATRIDLARNLAATHGSALADHFHATWQHVSTLCEAEPDNRVVRTRHGDAMLLSDFLLTRIVELAIHGLDLADALGRAPWLTTQAADAVLQLLLGPDHPEPAGQLGWVQAQFLRKATGREPLTAPEAAQIESLGIHWLTLG